MSHAAALLACLAGIKLVMCLAAAKHLYHAHWRTRQDPDRFELGFVLPLVAFVLVLCFARLAVLARNLAATPLRCLVGAVATILSITVFFTFAKVGNNYAFPVIQGILPPRAILDYLAVDLCFNPPFGLAYVAGFLVIWYALARIGREHWTLLGLGLLAALYLLLNSRLFASTAIFGWAIVAMGTGTLVASYWSRGPQGLGFYGWAVASIAFLLRLFAPSDPAIARPDPFHVLVFALALVLFVPLHIALRRRADTQALADFAPLGFLTFLLVADTAYPSAVNFRNGALLALSLGRYVLADAAIVASVLLSTWILAHRFPRAATRAFVAFSLVTLLLSVADLEVLNRMGVRLNWSLLTMSDDPVLAWRTIRTFVPRFLGWFGGLALLYLGLAHLVQRWLLRRFPDGPLRLACTPAGWLAPLLLTVAVGLTTEAQDKLTGSTLGNLVRSSRLVQRWQAKRLSADEFATRWRALDLPPVPATTGRPAHRPLNVVLLFLESTYNPYLSLFGSPDETQPLIKQFQSRMELFPNFHSSFANSLHARFATFNGIVPPNAYVSYINPHIEAPSLFELLKKDGCHVSLFYSSSREYTRFGDYLSGRGLDLFLDSDSMPGATATNRVSWGVPEAVTLAAIQQQFASYASSGQRFFLTYIPAAPHMPYDLPSGRFRQFPTGTPEFTGDYSGPYKNSLLYMDWVVSSILEQLRSLNLLDQTLVVITGDHGEMLGDRNKALGHGWCLEPWLTNVPLILMDPDRQGCSTNLVQGTQVDLLPTIANRLGIPVPPDHLYQGEALDRIPPGRTRTLVLNSHVQRAIVHGNRYYLYDPTLARGPQPTNAVRVFTLHNEGSRLDAAEAPLPPAFLGELTGLDAFQESLVLHYGYYRDLLVSGKLRLDRSR